MRSPIAILGAGAVGPSGLGWRGLSARAFSPRPSRQLAPSHPAALGFEVPDLAPGEDAGDGRQRKLMSQGARLGAIAIREALKEARWPDRSTVGCYLGVGASGAHMEEIPAALTASLVDGAFSEAAFGERGILACNPLFVFQLMNNFTLCHGSLLEGLQGPNGVFQSRGEGTLAALEAAIAALEDGACEHVLAGAADSAHHPVTWAELGREGLAIQGLLPGEGAAVFALAPTGKAPLGWIHGLGLGLGDAAAEEVWIAAPTPERRIALGTEIEARWRCAPRAWSGGEALAATPALLWTLGLDRLRGGCGSAILISEGLDGERLWVRLGRTP